MYRTKFTNLRIEEKSSSFQASIANLRGKKIQFNGKCFIDAFHILFITIDKSQWDISFYENMRTLFFFFLQKYGIHCLFVYMLKLE